MNMDRRAVIGTVGAVFLAGCSSDSSSSGSGGGGETIIDERDTVNEDQYLKYTFTLNQEATLDLSVTVRNGPNLDIVTTNQDELSEFEAGNRFRYNEALSLLDSPGGDATADMPSGDYAIIVDNTDKIEAQPPTNFDDDNARVEISLTAQ